MSGKTRWILALGIVTIAVISMLVYLNAPNNSANQRPLHFIKPDNSPAEQQNSAPQNQKEPYKRSARRIGNGTFPVPELNIAKIERLPPSNRSAAESKNLHREKSNHIYLKRPMVLDINTIQSGSVKVKIAGIEPVPLEKLCTHNGKTEPCGRQARTALRALIRARTITCAKVDAPDKDGNISTSCQVGKTDIGTWLVNQGWATAVQ